MNKQLSILELYGSGVLVSVCNASGTPGRAHTIVTTINTSGYLCVAEMTPDASFVCGRTQIVYLKTTRAVILMVEKLGRMFDVEITDKVPHNVELADSADVLVLVGKI